MEKWLEEELIIRNTRWRNLRCIYAGKKSCTSTNSCQNIEAYSVEVGEGGGGGSPLVKKKKTNRMTSHENRNTEINRYTHTVDRHSG